MFLRTLGATIFVLMITSSSSALANDCCGDHGKDKADKGAAAKREATPTMAQYFKIREALASDKTAGVNDAAKSLHMALKDQAAKLKKTKSLAAAIKATKAFVKDSAVKEIARVRKAFGELTKALVAVSQSPLSKDIIGQVVIFKCSMAKPYGLWFQQDETIGNPYYGSAMLRCGAVHKRVGAKKAPAAKG